MSNIEWTDVTWNPVIGCSPVSEGCRNCFAARDAIRLAGNPHSSIGPLYAGTSEIRGTGAKRHAVFTGVVRTVEDRLMQPLRWRKPRRVFVNSMSDLFHERVPFEFIDRVFAVMKLCPSHTFQILTKRPERAAEYLTSAHGGKQHRDCLDACLDEVRASMGWWTREDAASVAPPGSTLPAPWPWTPLPNVWLGTSCEDQAAADERIPHLLRCPAAVRFISAEPLLGPVDLSWHFAAFSDSDAGLFHDPLAASMLRANIRNGLGQSVATPLDWVIVGGESGPGARPCNMGWIESLVRQCRAAGVAAFVKQLGSWPLCKDGLGFGCPLCDDLPHMMLDKKGGDPAEWPEHLRVREFPESAPVPA